MRTHKVNGGIITADETSEFAVDQYGGFWEWDSSRGTWVAMPVPDPCVFRDDDSLQAEGSVGK